MTRPFETDAPARPAASGHVLVRAFVRAALVVFALLLVAGPSRTVAAPAAPVSSLAVAAGCDAVRSPTAAVAPIVVDADDAAHEPASADPLANVLLRMSGPVFSPPRSAAVATRNPALPERPPRRA